MLYAVFCSMLAFVRMLSTSVPVHVVCISCMHMLYVRCLVCVCVCVCVSLPPFLLLPAHAMPEVFFSGLHRPNAVREQQSARAPITAGY